MSPASRLLKSAQSTVSSPFDPERQTPLLNRGEDLIPSWITNQAHTAAPNSPGSPIPALVPATSVKGVDTNTSKCISTAPNSTSPAHEMGARESITVNERTASRTCTSPSFTLSLEEAKESNDHKTLNNLLIAEATLTGAIAACDPLSPACVQYLQSLATLRYHITAARADIAAAHNPKYLKDLTKATAIVQRDHHRLAREHAGNERERLRREREDRAAQRAREKQEHQERVAKLRIEHEKIKLQREQEKTYNRIHKESHKIMNEESNRIAAQNAATNDLSQPSENHLEPQVTQCCT